MAIIIKKPLLFGVLLAASVILNLFMGGMLAALYFQPTTVVPHSLLDKRAGADMRHLLHILSDSHSDIRALLQQRRSELLPKIRQKHQAHRVVLDKLGAEPFNPKVLQTTLAEMRQLHAEIQAAMHEVFVTAVSRLSAEQRRQLATVPRPFAEGRRGFRRHGFGRHMLQWKDSDGDGKLSREEFLRDMPETRQGFAELGFEGMDANGDGFISQEELP